MTYELTEKFCKSAKSKPGQRKTDYFDTVVTGFCFRVTVSGTKTFFFVYGPNTDREWLKLGLYGDLTLGEARALAKDKRSDVVVAGADPVAEKKADAAGQTVADLIASYLTRQASKHRTADEIARRLNKNVLPVIGAIKLKDLHKRDITRCIDLVLDRGARGEANNNFDDIAAMIRWAYRRGDLDINLVDGMQKPSVKTKRDRFLSVDEVFIMWRELADVDMWESTKRILRLCLLLGQRVGEVTGMRKDELHLERGLWRLPGNRTKNGVAHDVWLSDWAIAIIREQITDADQLAERKGRKSPEYVFPAPGGAEAVGAASIPKALKRLERLGKGKSNPTILGVPVFRPHDLRRTMVSLCEEVGISPFILGHICNHLTTTKTSITTSVYGRYDYAAEKRQALAQWADRLEVIVSGKAAKVVPIDAARRAQATA